VYKDKKENKLKKISKVSQNMVDINIKSESA